MSQTELWLNELLALMKTRIHSLFVILILLVTGCAKPYTYDLDEIPDFAPLAAPVAGTGLQIHVPPFPVPENFEREIFLRLPFGNTSEIYVNRFESLCRPGTHHLLVYGFADEDNEILPEIGVMRDQNSPDGRGNIRSNMSVELAYFLAQAAEHEMTLLPGQAIQIPANATVDINSHYFNKTEQTIFGEVFLNAYTMPVEEVEEVLLFDDVNNDQVLILPPGETTTISYTEIFEESQNLRMLVSHMHKRGRGFKVYMVGGAREGELLYTSVEYQHPVVTFMEPALLVEAGQGLRTEVVYENETNRMIEFGVTSEDEMGILFYLYSEI